MFLYNLFFLSIKLLNHLERSPALNFVSCGLALNNDASLRWIAGT